MKIQLGDLAWVAEPVRGPEPRWTRVRAVKVNRVWATFERAVSGVSYGMYWKMRLDSQNEGRNDPYQAHWFTDEQRLALELEKAATNHLRIAGVRVEYGSAWHSRAVELAKLIGWVEPPTPEWAVTDREDTEQ